MPSINGWFRGTPISANLHICIQILYVFFYVKYVGFAWTQLCHPWRKRGTCDQQNIVVPHPLSRLWCHSWVKSPECGRKNGTSYRGPKRHQAKSNKKEQQNMSSVEIILGLSPKWSSSESLDWNSNHPCFFLFGESLEVTVIFYNTNNTLFIYAYLT